MALLWGIAALTSCSGPLAFQSGLGGSPNDRDGREKRVIIKLDNGLEVVLEENHAAPVVAFQAWVKVGSADEPPQLAGIAHVFEHMLFKGTKRRGVGEIAREVESAGGEINAWTSHDETVYHLILASQFFDTGLDILADTLMNSSFDPEELERERKVVLEEIKQGLDDPSRQAGQGLFQLAFDQHPYGRPIIGTVDTVNRLSRVDLLTFFQEKYVANNITLVVVGDFNTKTAKEKIQYAFKKMPAGALTAVRPEQPEQEGVRIQVTSKEVKEAQVLFAFRTPDISHEDIPALDLLSVLLGQGDSSRLNLEIVRNRQLATDASAYLFSARDPGLMVVGASLPARQVEEGTRFILQEIFRLAHEEVPPAELAKARTILESDRVYDKETVQGYARKLGFFSAIAGDAHFEERYLAALQKVTSSDLRRVATRYLKREALSLFSLLPQTNGAKQTDKTNRTAQRLQTIVEKAEEQATARFGRKKTLPTSDDRVIRHVFPNGMKLLILRDSSVPVVALRATWVGGLRYEDERSGGISNLLASLIVRGTKSQGAEEIMHEVEGMAGSLSGFSGRNSLGIQAEFLSRHFERGFDLVADCLQNAAFSEDELEKERRIVLDDIRVQEDNLGQVVFKLFHSALWKKHPYRLDPLGTVLSISAMTRRKLLNHFRRHYNLNNLTLAVVGDVDPSRVYAKVLALQGGHEAVASEKPTIPTEPVQTAPVFVKQTLPKEQVHLVLGFPGVSFSDQDRFPLEILSHVLSGQGGRLFTEIREKRALAYRVSAFSMEGIDPGYFAVYIASSPENTDEAVNVVRQELKRILDNGISVDELVRAQRYLIGVHAIGLQRKSAIAAAIAFHEAYGQSYKAYRQYGDNILKVTREDILRIARRYLVPEREVIAVTMPKNLTPGAAKANVQPETAPTSPIQRSDRPAPAK
jgi:zinc protease